MSRLFKVFAPPVYVRPPLAPRPDFPSSSAPLPPGVDAQLPTSGQSPPATFYSRFISFGSNWAGNPKPPDDSPPIIQPSPPLRLCPAGQILVCAQEIPGIGVTTPSEAQFCLCAVPR